MRFRVLGPVTVEIDRQPVANLRPRQRAILGYLLLNSNALVSTDRLVTALWSVDAPSTARNQVQTDLSILRRLIRSTGGIDPIQTQSSGYTINIAHGDLDLGEFIAYARKARSAPDPATAIALGRSALGQWTGLPLGGITAAYADAHRVHLSEQHLQAYEHVLDLELRRGRHTEVTAELFGLLEAHPLRERLVGLLMLALYRDHRQIDALQLFRSLRANLAEEHGLDPGRSLQDLERTILRGDPSLDLTLEPITVQRDRPHLLPRAAAHFTGRAAQLTALDTLAAADQSTSPLAIISAVTGTAGVGKTALAIHWAHRAGANFPDGQLYVDLRGYHPNNPMQAIEALGFLLRALGVSPDSVPPAVDQAAALYRSMLADRRTLIVLDNARHVDQVRPLLPASAGSMVIVTSRDLLTGLIARDGGHRIVLDPLLPAEATTLITAIIGTDRSAAEPDATNDLAELCCHLPLALRIAAANLADQPRQSLAEYAARLRNDWASSLMIEEDPSSTVQAAFNESYRALTGAERRIFRLLGLVPGSDFTTDAIGALADLPTAEAASLLTRLADVHLVAEHLPGRFAMHDLLRQYATELTATTDSEASRSDAVRRLMTFLLGHVEAAQVILSPTVLKLPSAGTPAAFDGPADANAWLLAEQINICSAIEYAVRNGPADMAWLLLFSLRPHLNRLRATSEVTRLARLALTPAEAASDLRPQIALHIAIGDSYSQAGQLEAARDEAHVCVELSRRAGWKEAEVGSLNLLGMTCSFIGDLPAAATHLAEAINILDTTDVAYRRHTSLQRQGVVYALLGDLSAAAEHMERALACAYSEGGGSFAIGICLATVAAVYRQQGRGDLARQRIDESLQLNESIGAHHPIAIGQTQLAKILRDAGDLRSALAVNVLSDQALTASTDETSLTHARLTLGTIHAEMGAYDTALGHLTGALAMAQRGHNRHNKAECHLALGLTHLGFGRLDEARTDAQLALDIAARNDFHLLVGKASAILAGVAQSIGDTAEADDLSRTAATIYASSGHRMPPCPVSWLPTVSWP